MISSRYTTMPLEALARAITQDKLFDLTLYRGIEKKCSEEQKKILCDLADVEERHLSFWKNFFNVHDVKLTSGRKIKLAILTFVSRTFGVGGTHLIIEANERTAIQKYFAVWDRYKDSPDAKTIRTILTEEFKNQEEIVGGSGEKRINGDLVRNTFLGFNDGLVELLGAVSGFYIAIGDPVTVLIAGITVAIAGSLSMAAGVYVSESSDSEIEDVEITKKRFLGEHTHSGSKKSVIKLAMIVGISYIFGSLVPLLPAFLGSQNIYYSFIASAVMIIVVSYILSFLSGMEIRRRITINLIIIAGAVIITSLLGLVIKQIFGIVV